MIQQIAKARQNQLTDGQLVLSAARQKGAHQSRTGNKARIAGSTLLAAAVLIALPGVASAGLFGSYGQSSVDQLSGDPFQNVAAIARDDDVPMGFDTLNIELGGSIARPANGTQGGRAQGAGAGWLDGYNRAMLGLNQTLYNGYLAAYQTVVGAPDPSAPVPDPASVGSLGNVMLNLVNEPLTAVSSALTGDLANSGNAARRFAINSTLGLLGWWDVAGSKGYPAKYTDLGLTLCKYGVGEGSYVVLPLVGPRTLRDAFGDLAWSSAMTWTALGPGASQTTLQAGAVVEQTTNLVLPVSVTADVLASRYFDPVARRIMASDADIVRESYLAQRRERCAR